MSALLTLPDGRACSRTEERVGDVAEEPIILARETGNYVLLLEHEAALPRGTTVQGNVGVNAPGGVLRVGRRSVLGAGSQAAADEVFLQANTRVFDVFTNRLHRNPDRAVVEGVLTEPVTPPLFRSQALVLPDPFDPANFPPAFPIACRGAAVLGDVGEALSLSPDSYSYVRVARGGSLLLETGTYQFCELRVATRGTLAVSGPVTLNVRDRLVLGNESRALPLAGAPPDAITINVMGSSVHIGQRAVVWARLFAPDAAVRIGRETAVTGRIVAEALRGAPGFTAAPYDGGAPVSGLAAGSVRSVPHGGVGAWGGDARSDARAG
jgi:hypothetical protein